MTDLSHLRIEAAADQLPYTYAGGGGGGEFRLPPRDRLPHAQRLKEDLRQAEAASRAARVAQGLPEEGEGQILTVRSEQDFDLKLDSLERARSGIELLSVSRQGGITSAEIYVPQGKIVLLLRIIEAYETRTSQRSGHPRNRELVESIASIRLAALRDLWQDTAAFPAAAEELWWEVWLRASSEAGPPEVHLKFARLVRQLGMQVSDQHVAFPERVVTLAHGSQVQLGRSLDVLALIAELRKAKELATDYRELAPRDQRAFVDDLLARLVAPPADAPPCAFSTLA